MPIRVQVLSPFLIAPLLALSGCDSIVCDPETESCPLHVIDAVAAQVRLCGFPASQLDLSQVGPPHYLTSIGRVQVGQRLPLELRGDLDRIASINWEVRVNDYAPHPPRLRLIATGRYEASLVGEAPGGDDPADYAWADAAIVFKDGSEDAAAVSVCESGNWQPAVHLLVVP